MQRTKVVIFDLDDTLYKEIDFLKSAYQEIASYLHINFAIEDAYEFMIQKYAEGKNVFEETNKNYSISSDISEYLSIYRNHLPDIFLDKVAAEALLYLQNQGCVLGLITDGRTITQQNKIEALGLSRYLNKDLIIISEKFGSSKPDIKNYSFFQESIPTAKYFYIADNPSKDFISPNLLGWETICLLDNGMNIHKQDFSLPKEYLPKHRITSLIEVTNLI